MALTSLPTLQGLKAILLLPSADPVVKKKLYKKKMNITRPLTDNDCTIFRITGNKY